ncbi:MAG: DUF4445 domain-containing protein [Desulfobacteraceae bacterium]|nr:DUF4445 domain-containing protein [Desulfobacteraceae bacterium]
MSDSCEVVFFPENRRVRVTIGTTLLQAAREAGFHLEAQCNGAGTCGKCRVRAEGALTPPDPDEIGTLGEEVENGIRLACRAGVCGPVRVEFESDRTFTTVEKGEKRRVTLKPGIAMVSLAPADAGKEVIPLWDRFSKGYGIDRAGAAAMLSSLAETCANPKADPLVGVVRNGQLVGLGPEGKTRCLGIALDIGTTSMVAELVDLATGESLGIASGLNPQVAYGGDVLTRINYACTEKDGASLLHSRVIEGINTLFATLSRGAGVSLSDIYEMVVAANTAMLHLLMNVSPVSMAMSPYDPVFIQQMAVHGQSIGIDMAPAGMVTLMPSASAFVGSDIISGLVATEFCHLETAAIFIDIGTNGEIVTLNRGTLMGSSSAAGPALEGMNISCGSRAENGAIERVAILATGELVLKTVGDQPPRGLCGSGLIDLIAELVRTGVLEPGGRFADKENLADKESLAPALAARLIRVDDKPAFLVSREGGVTLTQKDIRQVQLAKGAIAAGISLLLEEQGLTPDEVETVFVAGAFGAHLRPDSLVGIGLLPEAFGERIRFVGNTSKEGARALLVNRALDREIRAICDRLTIRELSSMPEFQNRFVRLLGFPKKTMAPEAVPL